MLETDTIFILVGYSLHVHQAGAVRSSDKLCARSHVALQLVNTHSSADLRFLNGKHTTKASTLVGTFGFFHGDALLQFQQIYYLVEWLYVLFSRRTQAKLTDTVA